MKLSLLEKWQIALEIAADPDVSGRELAAALVLLDRMDQRGIVQVSHAVIAENTGQKRRNARYATDGLVEKRYFHQIGEGGPGCPNRYRRPDRIRLDSDARAEQVGHQNAPYETGMGQQSAPHGATGCPTMGQQSAHIPFTHDSPDKSPSPTPSVVAGTDVDFEEELWPIWPRKEGKKDALAAYAQARKIADHQVIMDGARRYVPIAEQREPQYRKLLAGWLRGKRWTDEPVSSANGNSAAEDRERQHQDALKRVGSVGWGE